MMHRFLSFFPSVFTQWYSEVLKSELVPISNRSPQFGFRNVSKLQMHQPRPFWLFSLISDRLADQEGKICWLYLLGVLVVKLVLPHLRDCSNKRMERFATHQTRSYVLVLYFTLSVLQKVWALLSAQPCKGGNKCVHACKYGNQH